VNYLVTNFLTLSQAMTSYFPKTVNTTVFAVLGKYEVIACDLKLETRCVSRWFLHLSLSRIGFLPGRTDSLGSFVVERPEPVHTFQGQNNERYHVWYGTSMC
jgi:hypothetical protein